MINPAWTRWINSSIAVYVKTVTDGLKLPLLFDGVDEREPEKMHYDHAELRVGGPFARELSKNYWQLNVDINILLTYLMRSEEDNVYDLQTWCGEFQEALNEPIYVYKYGGKPEDDQSYVGCLRPRTGRYEASRVLNFGQVSRVDRVRQSMIDTRHVMYLNT